MRCRTPEIPLAFLGVPAGCALDIARVVTNDTLALVHEVTVTRVERLSSPRHQALLRPHNLRALTIEARDPGSGSFPAPRTGVPQRLDTRAQTNKLIVTVETSRKRM